jgi:zinc protease
MSVMRNFVGMIFLCLPLAAFAGHEGAPVTEGPVTALDKLSSLQQMTAAAPEGRKFEIQHWQTKNGARVYFVEAHELPMLDVRLVFDAGGARDGKKTGLANVVNSMLDEGTATRDTSAIAAAFEQVGASYSSSSHRDMAVVQLRVLSDAAFRDPALSVLADVVANPQFPAESFSRIQQSKEVGLKQQEQSPAVLARHKFYKMLYGDHPYAEPTTGTMRSVALMTRQELLDFHKRYYVAKNLIIAIVGDLSREAAEKVAEQATQGLSAGEAADKLPAVKDLKKSIRVPIAFEAEQTHVLMGQVGIRHGDSDAFALDVGNEILGGGGFTSRLMKKLRQEKGMTYGVYSDFTAMRERGPFTINFSTRADQANEAIKLSQAILGDFVEKGPTDQELGEAKAAIVGSFPLATASNASISGYLGMIGFYGLPLDYLDQYLLHIQKVSKEDVKRAFQRHINPKKQLIVTVGKSLP